MKLLTISLATLISAGAYADTAVTANAPGTVSYSATVIAGAKFKNSTRVSGGNSAYNVGPYINPIIDVGYSNDQFSLEGEYLFKAWGAQGFGASGSKNKDTAMKDNSEFTHEPSATLTGKLGPNTALRGWVDLEYIARTGANSKNEYTLAMEPAIVHKINNTFTVAVSYYFERFENQDKAMGIKDSDITAGLASADKASAAKNLNAAIAAGTESPLTILHAGKVTLDSKITDRVSLNTFVRGGRYISNEGETANAIRIHNELKVTATPKLALKLRHRVNFYDLADKPYNNWDNRVRLIGTYSLTKQMGVYIENEFRLEQSTHKTTSANTKNEAVAGLSYSF